MHTDTRAAGGRHRETESPTSRRRLAAGRAQSDRRGSLFLRPAGCWAGGDVRGEREPLCAGIVRILAGMSGVVTGERVATSCDGMYRSTPAGVATAEVRGRKGGGLVGRGGCARVGVREERAISVRGEIRIDPPR